MSLRSRNLNLKMKMSEFKKWPKLLEDGSKVLATTFDLWDEEIESVLPRQEYYGRNRTFHLGGLGERLVLCLAKLLINLGQDPNR